jgi:hypothetical protein
LQIPLAAGVDRSAAARRRGQRVDACERGEQRRIRASSWAEHTFAELSQRGDEEYDVSPPTRMPSNGSGTAPA